MLLLLFTIFTAANGANVLYPFGLNKGDVRSPAIDDDCSITYNHQITMFGQSFSTLYVCTNGVVSLDREFTSYTTQKFPLQNSAIGLICPYWADANMDRNGSVWSRESTVPVLLRRASLEVRDAFRTGSDATYNATWMMIATWKDVTPYGTSTPPLGNTFQVVIVSDGQTTFALFNYETIKWATGSASSIPAQVGFDSGDGVNYYATPKSRKPGIINVASQSNIGTPGKMIFKLGITGSNSTKIALPNKPSLPPNTSLSSPATTTTHQSPVVNSTNITISYQNMHLSISRKEIRGILSDGIKPVTDNTTAIVAACIATVCTLLTAVVVVLCIRKRIKGRINQV